MQEKILEILKNSGKALSYEEIHSYLNLETIEETKSLIDVLDSLVNDGSLYLSKKNKYMLFNDGPLKKGILSVNKKGFGFVAVEGQDDVFIGADNLNGALDSDLVAVEITISKDDGKKEGRVVKIIKRVFSNFVGEVKKKKGNYIVYPDDESLKITVELNKKDTKNVVDGHKVIVKMTGKASATVYKGYIEKIIGHKNDPGVDILSIVYKHGISTEFSKETMEYVDDIPSSIHEDDFKGRRDLRDWQIFTIDGDDTKDIDDALSLKKLDNGNYELGVHIADVSYYVKDGSPLNDEALERGTSVYLVDRVIPMLPHKLSNGICSLNPGEDRLSISCVMEINSKGSTVNYEIFPSVIRSNIQMTYKKVNKIIEEDKQVEGYGKYETSLKLMDELSVIIRKNKEERGYIDFASQEAKILVDDTGRPTDVVLRERGRGENIIEDFMIQANECVATHIYNMDLPFIYRVHESPKEERVRSFLSFLSSLAYIATGDMKTISSKSMQKLVNSLREKPEFPVLANLVLRTMQKAVYQSQNLGHYGLGSKCYSHFTSPIRRYPDLIVHRLLRTYLFDANISNETVNRWRDKLEPIAEHSSVKERTSIDCEREVESMKMAEYMEDKIGEEFEGLISGVANFGMFVQLDNLIEGLVPVSEMNDYYVYDEATQTLTGERAKKSYRLGEKVRVKLIRASKEEQTIDFTIVGESKNAKKEA